MKTLYLDCFAGIAGDMFIGALLNLVPNPEIIRDEIGKIHAIDDEYDIIIEHTTRNGIAGIILTFESFTETSMNTAMNTPQSTPTPTNMTRTIITGTCAT